MPWISISASQKNNHYGTQGSVKEKDYDHSRLFVKYEHKSNTKTSSGTIRLYETYSSLAWTNYLTLNHKADYAKATLTHVDVYYNRYETSIPLLLVLYFNNGTPRYHRYSLINYFILNNRSMDIKDFTKYNIKKNDEQFLDSLFAENDNLKNFLTFYIDKRISGRTSEYNTKRIKIDKVSNPFQKSTHSGLTKYTHTPQGTGIRKKGCLIYHNNPLVQKNGNFLYTVQNISYSYINVYWSTKIDVPLLLEFNVDTKKLEKNEFYCHSFDNRLFWEKLDYNNFERFTSYKISKTDNVYKQLIDSNNSKLIKLLETLILSLSKTVVFLVDKFNGKYGELLIKEALGNNNPRLLSTKNKINIVDISNTFQEKCVNGTNFKVYEHEFSDVVKSVPSGEQIKLIFIRSNVESSSIGSATIYFDKTYSTRYMYGSYEVLISPNYNTDYNYTWYRHSSEGKITKGIYYLSFKGQTLRMNNDLSEKEASNQIVIVYYQTGETDYFILAVFPSPDESNIRYMTYPEFKKGIANSKEICLSNLNSEKATTSSVYDGQLGNRTIDPKLLKILKKETDKYCVLYIQLDKKNEEIYYSGSSEINVSERNDEPNKHKIIEHQFSSELKFYDISIEFRGLSKFLDTTDKFENKIINSINFYFHKDKPQVPLLIGLKTTDSDKKYYKFSEFIHNTENVAKLSDLKEVIDTYIQSELTNQHSNLSKDITLDIFKTQSYSGFNLSSPYPYGNYKYYIHSPSDSFGQITLKNSELYEFKNLTVSGFTYQNILSITIYYHGLDKDNSYPLIIKFVVKNTIKQNEFVFENLYYHLTEIHTVSLKKIYQKTEIYYGNLTKTLNIAYQKSKDIIDKNLRLNDPGIVDCLLYSKNKTKLYVYFYGDDPRPMLICYEDEAYKRIFIDERSSQWIKIPNVHNCLCNDYQQDQNILSALEDVARSFCLIKTELPSTKEEQDSLLQINLSKKAITYSTSKKIIASHLEEYSSCNLFHYCTHTVENQFEFVLSSLIIDNPERKTITIEKPMNNVTSAKVYYNAHLSNIPVLLEITTTSGSKYYKNLVKDHTEYELSSLQIVQESHIIDELINESDKVNRSLTYQIEEIPVTGAEKTYGYSLGIKVTKEEKKSHNFIVYKHEPIKTEQTKGFVLFKKKLLYGRTNHQETVLELQNKEYKSINVYTLDTDPNLPLMLEFNEQSSTFYYIKKFDDKGEYWINIKDKPIGDKVIKSKLIETNYPLRNSVIIRIDQKNSNQKKEINYEMKSISNRMISEDKYEKNNYDDVESLTPKTVRVSVSTKPSGGNIENINLFRYVSHQLEGFDSQSIDRRNIAGVRIFLSKNVSSQPEEIELYNDNISANNRRNRVKLYYPSVNGTGKIYVYFHVNDPRPLLFCYDFKVYQRLDKNDNIKWVPVKGLHKCFDFPNIFRNLKIIYSQMSKKFTFSRTGNRGTNIVPIEEMVGDFKRVKYMANLHSSNIESQLTLSKANLISELSNPNQISKLLDGLDGIQYEVVSFYYNNDRKNPLLFEFTDGADITHYQRLDDNGTYWINKRVNYVGNEKLINELEIIRTNTNDTIVYEIDSTGSSYNNNITLLNESGQQMTLFNKFKHTPRNGPKKSYILYNRNVLENKEKAEIKNLQHQEYSKIVVYFSKKAKILISGMAKNLPLLVEFTIKDKPNEPDYYVHKKNPSDKKYYWEKLSGDNGKSNVLSDLLTDMGFGMNQSEAGYQQLKRLLTSVTVDLGSGNPDLSTKLKEITPEQLKKLLDKEVGNNGSKKSLLVLLLRQIEFNLVDSLVILLDKKESERHYRENEISPIVSNLEPQRDINRVKMQNGGKNITVNDVTTNGKGKCVKHFGYKLIEHNITQAIGEPTRVGQSFVGIRFFKVSETSAKNYNQIRVYNGDQAEPQNIEYIYYSRGQNEIFVYFYGKDPRPLIICYNGSAYKPKKKAEPISDMQVIVEYTTWLKIADIGNCTCQNGDTTGPPNDKLLEALTNVVGYLNPVQINPKNIPNIASKAIIGLDVNNTVYDLHRYSSNDTVKIKISSDNLKCYRKYTYEPADKSGGNTNYRLGNVFYTSKKHSDINKLDYSDGSNKYNNLILVEIYYNVFDKDHNHPLLVMLKFNGNNEEYHELNDSTQIRWIKLNDSIDSKNIEKKAYDIKIKLGISLQKDANKRLFDPRDCKEDDPDLGLYVGAPVGSIAGAGAIGGGGYLLYAKVIVTAISVAPS